MAAMASHMERTTKAAAPFGLLAIPGTVPLMDRCCDCRRFLRVVGVAQRRGGLELLDFMTGAQQFEGVG